jgi:hypothetical protein
LRGKTKTVYEDINDVLELYSIKQYLDNDLFLKSWTKNEIRDFKQKASEYGKIAGQFMSKVNDSNVICYFEQLLHGYINSFWQLVNNQKIFKQISAEKFETILKKNQHEIRNILPHKNIVNRYDTVLRDFLFTYPQGAEIILSIYEEKDDFRSKEVRYLPQSLTNDDKEIIVSNYIDYENSNLNYLRLIIIARNRVNFKLSDKTRLKAKRREKLETDKMFEEQKNISVQKYGVSISYPENPESVLISAEKYTSSSAQKYTIFFN